MGHRPALLAAVLGVLISTSPDAAGQCVASGGSSGSGSGSAIDGSSGSFTGIRPIGGAVSGGVRLPSRPGRSGRAPTTGRPRGNAPVSPGRRGEGRGGSAVNTAQLSFVPTQENWSRWWSRQGDEFIWGQARTLLPDLSLGAVSSRSGNGLATPAPERSDDGHSPLRRSFVQTRVIAPLLGLVQDEREDEALRESAIRALSAAVDPRFAYVVTDALVPRLKDTDERIRSAAALALGVAGDPGAVDALRDLAFCSTAGHELVGEPEVSRRVRAAALLGLGYSGSPDALAALTETIDALPDSESEMKRAAIMSLGLLRDGQADGARELLVALLKDPRLDDLLKAEVPPALARLSTHGAVPALLHTLEDRDTDRLVRQSCAIALGRLARMSDEPVVRALLATVTEERDEATRNFATIALARVGASDPHPEERQALHSELTRRLEHELWRPEHRRDGPFHALAAGLYMHAHPGRAPELHERLRDRFDEVSDPAIRGAYALALGMAGDPAVAEELREAFRDVKDPVFRAHCALSMGLLGDRQSLEELREVVEEKGLPPALRWALGAGLMLLDDVEAPERLVAAFEDASSLEHRTGLALALASQRHEEVVPSLMSALSDDSLDAGSRTAACAALAGVADRAQLPWRSALSLDSNFVAGTPTVDDVLGIP